MWRGKFFLNLLALLLLLAAPALARNPAGKLSGTPRWSGEIVLSQPVTVPKGVTLAIAAGTRIRATKAEATLVISGTLLARGTAEKPIIFDTPPGWQGIHFFEAPEVSELEHLTIDGAATAISSIAAKFAVRFCSFTGNGTAIKLLRESYPLVEDCRFADNDIAIDNEMKSVATIRRNRFTGHKNSAIIASHNSGGPIIDNLFEKNSQAIALLQKYPDRVENNRFIENGTGIFCNQTQATPRIQFNSFEKNENALINFSFAYPLVENNRFVNNGTAVRNDQFSSPNISRNLFQDNRTALFNDRKSNPTVEFNQFEGNELAFFCDHSSYPLIRNNNLIGSRVAVRLGQFQSADWEQRAGSKRIVQQKAMEQNSRNPLLEGAPTEFRDRVDLSGNWWGDDTAQLRKATEESNLDLFHDRFDQPTVTYEGYGDESYRLDRIVYQPILDRPVADTRPKEAP